MTDTNDHGHLLKRYHIWSKTRYPAKGWVFSSLVFIAIAVFIRQLSGDVFVEPTDIVKAFAVGCFFLLLRIYDEHKDYEIDLEFHPERPVASGIVKLIELRYLFGAALIIQLALNITLDGGTGNTTVAWGFAFFWSILMAKEFFIGEWLQKRLLIYALSHMLIMIPLAYWMIFMTNPDFSLSDFRGLVIGAIVFLTGAVGEVARKIKSPQDEIDGVDSYSSVLGIPGVLSLLVILDLCFYSSLSYLVTQIGIDGWRLGLCLALPCIALIVALYQGAKFAKHKSDGQGKKIEDSQGILILMVFVSLILSANL